MLGFMNTRTPFDPELIALLGTEPPSTLDAASLHDARAAMATPSSTVLPVATSLGLVHETVEGPVEMSLFHPAELRDDAPIFLWIHGGGQIMGTRFNDIIDYEILHLAAEIGVLVIAPEYRLAPEHPGPAGVEDCYSALLWAAENYPGRRILVGGVSGGGGLAAGTCLLARDRGEVTVDSQLLACPMLDDRHLTPSSQLFAGANARIWPREKSEFAWDAVLGHGHESRDVSPYLAPARATDLAGLPPTFIDVGDSEVYRDECIAYAAQLLASGVPTELHVWPGGFHVFDAIFPAADVSRRARFARREWLRWRLS
ncbi:esterase/lipase [Corynebacterium testudinoris]|uniref:Esterase/lipase n=2 Tax=Corynebacterium testudinoris TaxID=136857 RepID=A0A0G3H8P0_9CORY|nr:esterase/lipase [Corynebacterium testudinoris]